MQPYLFPYLGYFQLIQAVDKFILLDDVNFIKRGWVNRNRILVNGKDHLFSLPLQRASQFKKINDLKLADYPGWRNRFFKTLTHAYRQASQYEPVMKMLHQALPQTAGGAQWAAAQEPGGGLRLLRDPDTHGKSCRAATR